MTNQQKSRKRRDIMDAAAVKITKDPLMTWRRFETRVKVAFESGKKIKLVIE